MACYILVASTVHDRCSNEWFSGIHDFDYSLRLLGQRPPNSILRRVPPVHHFLVRSTAAGRSTAMEERRSKSLKALFQFFLVWKWGIYSPQMAIWDVVIDRMGKLMIICCFFCGYFSVPFRSNSASRSFFAGKHCSHVAGLDLQEGRSLIRWDATCCRGIFILCT